MSYRRVRLRADGLRRRRPGFRRARGFRVINEQRQAEAKQIMVEPFRELRRGVRPGRRDGPQAAEQGLFRQCPRHWAWWSLRLRFQATYRAVVEGMEFNPVDLISIDPDLPDRAALVMELSQPTYSKTPARQDVLVNKQPDGTKSPNLADGVIAYQPGLPRTRSISGRASQRKENHGPS